MVLRICEITVTLDFIIRLVLRSSEDYFIQHYLSECTGGNVVRGNGTVMQMKSLRNHPDMSYGSNKQWNQLCE